MSYLWRRGRRDTLMLGAYDQVLVRHWPVSAGHGSRGLFFLVRAFEYGPYALLVSHFMGANTGYELIAAFDEILFCDRDGCVLFGRWIVEEVCDCYGRCMCCVVFLRFLVDGACLSCDCFKHGVRAERVHVGTRICKW